jgi:hypothetical protein
MQGDSMSADDLKDIVNSMTRVGKRLKNLDLPLDSRDAFAAIKENCGRALNMIRILAMKGDITAACEGITFLRESYKLISTLLGASATAPHAVLDAQLDKACLRMSVKPHNNTLVFAVTGHIDEALRAYNTKVLL